MSKWKKVNSGDLSIGDLAKHVEGGHSAVGTVTEVTKQGITLGETYTYDTVSDGQWFAKTAKGKEQASPLPRVRPDEPRANTLFRVKGQEDLYFRWSEVEPNGKDYVDLNFNGKRVTFDYFTVPGDTLELLSLVPASDAYGNCAAQEYLNKTPGYLESLYNPEGAERNSES